MNSEKVAHYVFELMQHQLPASLHYHNMQHTKDVLAAATEIATAEKVEATEMELLKTAVLLHDTGFVENPTGKNHEEESCAIARNILPSYNYSGEETESVCRLIMATKTPQAPKSHLEEILCDADLFYLGTDNFQEYGNNLYKELQSLNMVSSYEAWNEKQIQFVSAHTYFTKSARQKLNAKKLENLTNLKAKSAVTNMTKHKTTIDAYAIFKDIILMIAGVITAGFGLRSFLVPNQFFDGGMSGISLLIHELYHFNLSYIIIVANIPFIIMGAYVVNWEFAIKTFICIILLGVCFSYFPYPVVTSDKLLVSIFGGFFLGTGIGLTMRAGCALDGIEVLGLYTGKRSSFTVTEIVFAINVIIFSIAAIKFGIQTSLYSMLTYFAASKTVDYVVEGIEEYTGVTIISSQSETIKDRLVNELGRGITIYKGERGYLPGAFEIHSNADIIFTVITRLEMRRLKNLVSQVDPHAFVFASTIKEASGGVIKKIRRH